MYEMPSERNEKFQKREGGTRNLVLLLAISTALSEPHFGYFYPKPTPLCLPEVYIHTILDCPTEPLVHYATVHDTVYLTNYLTSTVEKPVYLTTTKYAVSTVAVPQIEYVTQTSTVVVQPSPVVQYVTETVVSTIVNQALCGDSTSNSYVAPPLSYLPPHPPSNA
ncbi:uncharacterized protein LOC128266914 [Anopheles cruzii]|uniref:uncharacterized protein LOC128266914 n=1 Tax=Anopheles cruzii TaxID=68878 RepID=UPI0022EC24D3|nr:uncharacterized protein LOC128266914 [Anopheles cruzii]